MRPSLLVPLLALSWAAPAFAASPPAKAPEPVVTQVMSQALPEYPGKEGLVLTVTYPPGGADPVHRHDAHGFVYVLEGHVVMAVAGGREVTLGPGEAFHEGPADVHTVGRNASQTEPAKFVVFLLKDSGKPALLPAH
ncbi:MAG TPA: cupin domain-containing protein [Stenotrophomonas sp.]|nr:cupin domain-containing protein [Stenotrophomonas sp.]